MLRPSALLKRSLIFVHRWLGVVLSVIFLLWFVSGIVMMYWTFPAISQTDRLARAPVLDPARLTVSAEQAAATAGSEGGPTQVRLGSYDGRPVFRFGGGRGRDSGPMVFADDGRVPEPVDDAMADRVAAAWTGRPLAEARKEWVEEIDQWTVGGLRSQLPLQKYSWPDGQEVYVNDRTGEVVQYTTTASRVWAYLGAIPHWLYFTPLRKHQAEWFSFVVWSSLIGTIAALIGVVIAVWMYSPRRRYRYAGAPTSIPYSGWKRWHTVAGLFFGVITVTWTFSGLLSMGPFPIMDRLIDLTVPAPQGSQGGNNAGTLRGRGAGPGGNIAGALRGVGVPLSAYAAKPAPDAIRSVADFEVKELEYTSFAGEPIYVATNSQGRTRIVPVHGEPKVAFAIDDVMRVVREAAGSNLAELTVLDQYDAYYLDRRREAPLPVVLARMNDPLGTRIYIDPGTARVVRTYNARGWVSRWLYNGLHSLDFPWLYNHRPLWDILVITLMLGGTGLCLTSLILTWRVLARKVAAVLRTRSSPPSEDLALEGER